MEPKVVADSFSLDAEEAAANYLESQGQIEILDRVMKQADHRIAPEYPDLARLHQAIRTRKVFSILEFGLGYSTIVMADALLKNSQDWNRFGAKPRIRNSTPFQLHSVDASKMWVERTREMIPEHLLSIITLHHSPTKAGTFQDRACHYYDDVPDIVPDFIYLDGPDPATVTGNIGGLTWSNPDRTVTSGDILRMEPQLLPGTLIIVDGRTANARFLATNLDRRWQIERNVDGDVTIFELQETPLGSINNEILSYCLGERILSWEF